MTLSISVQEVGADFAAVLSQLKQGDIIITQAGKPMAKLSAIAPDLSVSDEPRHPASVPEQRPDKPAPPTSLLAYAGCVQGLYGSSVEEVQAYQASLRQDRPLVWDE